jgi:hypothetical protein
MNVILSFWSPTNAGGFPGSVVPCTDGGYDGTPGTAGYSGCYPVSDYTPWWAMWQQVINTYASYGNVYLQPYNEVAGYSNAATGYVGPTPTQLTDVDASWLAHYPDFPRGRVIFGGAGDDYYLALGNDPRLDGTLLSYHPYCSFGLSFPTEAAWTSWLKGQVDGMESRTIITEFGLGEGRTNFDGPRDGNSCVSYVYAVTDYARSAHLGLVYWDYGSTDSWSVATRTGSGTAADPYVTHIRDQSFVDRLEWGYGLSLPLAPTIGSPANATFYTGASSNKFTVQTTGDPLASLTATGPGAGGALPAGVTFVDNGDGTATLSGNAAALIPGVYTLGFAASNSQGPASQTFTLTVTAGSPPPATTGVIAGTITNSSGQPLADVCAHVFVASTLPGYTGNNYAPAIYQTCSASDGSYSIPLVTPGTARYNVQFIDGASKYQPQWYGDTSGPGTAARMGYNHPGTAISVAANSTTTVNAVMVPLPSGITATPTVLRQPGATSSSYAVSGTITVTNYNNVALTGVVVTDAINDPSATCVVTAGTGVTIPASPLYPAPPVTASFPYTCTYAAPPTMDDETDSATATWAPNNNVPNTSYQYAQPFSFLSLPVGVGGTVASQLAVSLPTGGVQPVLGTFVAGLGQSYSVTMPATITSTAQGATLTAADTCSPGPTCFPGHLVNTGAVGGPYDLAQGLQVDATSTSSSASGGGAFVDLSTTNPATILTYTSPVSNDNVTVGFLQPVAATDPLRTGNYSKTITLTLSTTTP